MFFENVGDTSDDENCPNICEDESEDSEEEVPCTICLDDKKKYGIVAEVAEIWRIKNVPALVTQISLFFPFI